MRQRVLNVIFYITMLIDTPAPQRLTQLQRDELAAARRVLELVTEELRQGVKPMGCGKPEDVVGRVSRAVQESLMTGTQGEEERIIREAAKPYIEDLWDNRTAEVPTLDALITSMAEKIHPINERSRRKSPDEVALNGQPHAR
jgi:hypothetical protein